MKQPEDDNTTGAARTELATVHDRTVLTLILATSLAAPIVIFGIYLREGTSHLFGVAVALEAMALLLLAMYLTGFKRWLPHVLIYGLMLLSTAGVLAQGSIRGASVNVLMATVVGAGVFLSRQAMVFVAGSAMLILAGLTHAELAGMLKASQLEVSWATWVTHVSVLGCLVVSVTYGRYRLEDTYRAQLDALDRARRTEQSLRDTEHRFRVLFRSNPAASIVQSLDTLEILDANDAFLELFGFSRDDLVGQRPPRLWANAQDQLAFRASIDALGKVEGLRATGMRRDGSTFDGVIWAEVAIQGGERMVIAMVMDISSELRSRRELEKSQERFAKAFNFSPLGMTITRLSDGRFMEVNPAHERVLGWHPSDFTGRTSLEVGVWLSDADRQRYVDTLQRDGRLQAYETRMRDKQGHEVEVRIWAEIIELDGERCALSFTMNVSAEKRREAMLLRVAEGVSPATGQAFFLSLAEHLADAVGASGVVIGEINSAHTQQLDTLALLVDGSLQPNRDLQISHSTYTWLLATDDLVVLDTPSRQVLLSTPPFDPDTMETIAGLALRDPDGTPIGLIATVWPAGRPVDTGMRALLTIFASRCNAELVRLRRDREILQLQDTLEQRVQARTEQLQYLNRELDAFAYSVSHDLKSPLRSIDGFMHLLQEQMDGRLKPEDEDLMRRVMTAVTRMNSLIADLLALARVSQGQLQRMEVDLSDLAEGVVRQERHRDPTREVEVVIATGLKANCDPRMAQIVLENLIGNAWKYSRQKADARIEIGLERTAPLGPPLFYIRDNGAGFDMTRADRLFKPFNRLHSANEFEGSGIGLATVRRIIERHGGLIRAEAQVGQGATFRFGFGTGEEA
jgi:PAS domain S-box-containing protein